MYLTKTMNAEEKAVHVSELFRQLKSAKARLTSWREQDLKTLVLLEVRAIRAVKRELIAYGGLTWQDM